jgi:hypothetical protein
MTMTDAEELVRADQLIAAIANECALHFTGQPHQMGAEEAADIWRAALRKPKVKAELMHILGLALLDEVSLRNLVGF